MSEKRYTVYEGPRVVKTIGSPNPGLSNKDPIEEELEKQRKWASEFRSQKVLYNKPPGGLLEQEKKLQYTRLYEPEHACICGTLVTRRLADTKYDYLRDYEVPDFRKTDFPQQMYINADESAPRDKWGNLEPPQVHYCNMAELSNDKKFASLQQQLKTSYELINELTHELKKLREEAQLKAFVIERR